MIVFWVTPSVVISLGVASATIAMLAVLAFA